MNPINPIEQTEMIEGKESFDDFCKRMELVESDRELMVGRSGTRSIFIFEGQHCHYEMVGGGRPPPFYRPTLAQTFHFINAQPEYFWIHAKLFYTRKRAEMLKKYFNADGICEETYAQEEGKWFALRFDEDSKDKNPAFPRLMKLVYMIYTGGFVNQFGEEPAKYVSCIRG